MVETMMRAQSALSGHAFETGDARATPVEGLIWAAITLRRGQRSTLAQRLDAAFGLALPDGPGACFAGATTLLWAGSDRFTLLHHGASLADIAGDAADVTDLTGSQVTLAITGPGARNLLGKLVAIDLHPRSFRAGSAAATLLGHFGVTLWQTDDAPSYCLSCYRSFADGLWHAVKVAGGKEQEGSSSVRQQPARRA